MRGRLGCAVAVAYPIVEIVLLIALAQWVGLWWVLVYLVMCVVLGLGLVRYALGATGRSFGLAVSALRAPSGHGEVLAITAGETMPITPPAQTLLIVPAGLLIAVPGVITTLLGLLLWIPPVRARIAARIERAARRLEPPSGP